MKEEFSTDKLLAKLNSYLEHLNINMGEDILDEIEDNISQDIEIINEAKKCLLKIKHNQNKIKQKRNKYTLEIKKDVLTLINYNISRHIIENDYEITRKTIRDLEKKEEIFKENKKIYKD